MGSIRTIENIARLTKASGTSVTLGASRVNIGAQQFPTTATLTLNTGTVGVGGLDAAIVASSVYYVYAVISGGVPALIGSLNTALPSGYTQARKVGAFTTGATSQVLEAFYYGQGAVVEGIKTKVYTMSDFVNATGVTISSSFNTLDYFRVGENLRMRGQFLFTNASAGSDVGLFQMKIPLSNLTIADNGSSRNKYVGGSIVDNAAGTAADVAGVFTFLRESSTSLSIFMNNGYQVKGTDIKDAANFIYGLYIDTEIPIAEWAGSGTQFIW